MANSPGSRNRGKRGGAAAQGGGAPAPAGEADAGTSAQDPAPPNEEASSSRGDGAPPGADGAAAADVSDADEWEPLERPALGVPLAYVARQPGTDGVPWRQEHLSGSEPALHAPSMASDDLRGQVARRLSSLDGANAPAYPKEMQQLKLVHTSGVLSRILLDSLEEAYEVSARQLAVNDAGAYTGGFVDDPAAAVTTLDCDDLPPPEHRTGYYGYDTLHYQTACTRDAIPTLRRLVDLIGALETTFLQRYAPGQDLAKWNKKQDALLRRVGAAGAAPASAAEAFVAGIDDSELQRELHLPRLAAASRQGPAVGGEAPAQAAAPPVTPPVPRAGGPAGSRARRGGGRGRGGGGGGGGSRAAAAAA
jgi:hypothetical protein